MLNFLLILFVVFLLLTIFTAKRNENVSNTISLDESHVLRGISILFVILHHICQRVDKNSIIHFPFLYFVYLFVGLFFFLSGYGNYISISKNKKTNNDKCFPFGWFLRRLIYILFFFLIGFIINFLFNTNLYIKYDKSFFLDLVLLTYKPYTLWYLKVLVILYFLTFILFSIFSKYTLEKQGKLMTIGLFVIVIVYIFLCNIFKVGNYWWNSVIAYPIGILYAQNKGNIKNKFYLLFIFIPILFVCLFLGLKIKQMQPITLIIFLFTIIVFLHLFNLKRNPILIFLGKHSLGIYLYHLIFLTFFSKTMNTWYNSGLIILTSVFLTIIVNLIYTKVIRRHDKKVNEQAVM